MTRQEMFDKAAQGILAQGAPSYDPERQACMYRGPNGTKCAIGHLISDKKYNFDLEFGSPAFKEVQKAAGIKFNQVNFATSLQLCHDGASIESRLDGNFIFEFRRRMRDLAKRYKLNAAVLETGQ